MLNEAAAIDKATHYLAESGLSFIAWVLASATFLLHPLTAHRVQEPECR
jgi:hypothetical protein